MAIFKQVNKKYETPEAAVNLLNYIRRGAYSWGIYPGFISGDGEVIWAQMNYYKNYFGKADGNLLEHYALSFDTSCYEKDIPLGIINMCAYILAELFIEFQPVWGIHLSYTHYHIHLVINTVCVIDGKEYHKNPSEFQRLLIRLADELKDYHIALMPVAYYDETGRLKRGSVPSTFLYQNKDPFIYG